MKFAERKRLVDRQSYVAQYVSLAVLSIGKRLDQPRDYSIPDHGVGVTSLLGSDDLLSAFACGCAFAWEYVVLVIYLLTALTTLQRFLQQSYGGCGVLERY